MSRIPWVRETFSINFRGVVIDDMGGAGGGIDLELAGHLGKVGKFDFDGESGGKVSFLPKVSAHHLGMVEQRLFDLIHPGDVPVEGGFAGDRFSWIVGAHRGTISAMGKL